MSFSALQEVGGDEETDAEAEVAEADGGLVGEAAAGHRPLLATDSVRGTRFISLFICLFICFSF